VAIAFVGAGAAAAANNANISPALPAGVGAGDLMIVFGYSRGTGSRPQVPTGWTEIVYDLGFSIGRFMIAYRFWQSGDTAPLLSGGGATNDTVLGQVCAFSGVDATTPIEDEQVIADPGTNDQNLGPITLPAAPTSADAAVIVAAAKSDNWTSVATLTGDSQTWVEIGEPSSTLGSDAGLVWNYALTTGTPSLTSKTFTVTGGAGSVWQGISFTLKAASTGTTLSPAGLTRTRAIGSPTLSPGSAPGALVRTRAQGALQVNPTLGAGAQTHTRALGAPAVSLVSVVSPGSTQQTRALGGPTVSPGLAPGGQLHARALGNLATNSTVAPGGQATVRALGVPTVDIGGAPPPVAAGGHLLAHPGRRPAVRTLRPGSTRRYEP
jgi:hypothetical protein